MVLLAVLLPVGAPAASLTTETFAVSASGWTQVGTPVWVWTNGFMQSAFPPPNPGPPPMPGDTVLRANGGSSGGAFTGNYWQAGAEWIGFDFMAMDTIPAGSFVTLEGVTGALSSYFSVGATGVWQPVRISIANAAAGGWSGIGSPPFEPIVTNVQFLNISVEQNGTTAQRYAVDNVFLGRSPSLQSVTSLASGSIEIEGSAVQPQWVYRMERTTNLLSGEWQLVESFTATNTMPRIIDSGAATNGVGIYRLIWE